MSFTENQKTTLSSYFNNGMVGIGRNFQTQITTACAETGLTAKQVKNWITKEAHKRRLIAVNQQTTSQQASGASTSTDILPRKDRTKSGWNIFQREFAATNEGKNSLKDGMPAFNRNAAAKFKGLDSEAKHHYDELATTEEKKELSEIQKANRISSIFTKLRDHTCQKLQDHGCHTLVLGFKKDQYFTAESPSIKNRLTEDQIQQIHSWLFTNNGSEKNIRKSEYENKLRRDVQDLFNAKYHETTGRDTPFPYKRKSEFAIDGLPDVPFRKPSGYGVAQLKKIMESRDNIKIRIKEPTLTSAAVPSTTTLPLNPLTFPGDSSPASTPSISIETSASVYFPSTSFCTTIFSPRHSNTSVYTSAVSSPSSSSSCTFFSPARSPAMSTGVNLESSAYPALSSGPSSSHHLDSTISPVLSESSLSTAPFSSLQGLLSRSSVAPLPSTSVDMVGCDSLPSVCVSFPNALPSVPVTATMLSSEPSLTEHNLSSPGETYVSIPDSSSAAVASVSNAPSGLNPGFRKRKLKRPGQKERESPVYPIIPFWSKVRVQDKNKLISVAEGIIIPGFQTENGVVGNDFYRKIYITKVLDIEGTLNTKEGTVVIRPFNLLLPEDRITEGVGGLVGLNIPRNARKLKLEEDQEELCAAKSCQAPQAHNSQLPNGKLGWVQCDSVQCKKWYHLQCVGLIDADLPRKWFCGCSKFERETVFRSDKIQYRNLEKMLDAIPEVENHLRNVLTERTASVRHVIWTKYSRRERHFIHEHLFAGVTVPFTDDMFDEFSDIVMGLFLSPDNKWTDERPTRIDYCDKVLLPEAFVKFLMVVEGISRNTAEEILFNWTNTIPALLAGFYKK